MSSFDTSSMVFAPGRRDFGQRGAGGGARRRRRQRRGHLEVRGVVVAVGERDRVFAGIREHVEFLGRAAADGARVRDAPSGT